MTVEARAARGEYAKTAERRRQILDAALQVFSGSGYRKGSLRDVADRAGLSQAGLLHHYPTKGHLLEAVLTRRDEEAVARMGADEARGLDVIRRLLELARHNEANPQLIALHLVLAAEATSPDHPVHDYFVRRSRDTIEWVREALQTAADRGELRPGVDPVSVSKTFLAAWDGLQLIWLMDRDAVDVPTELRRYLEPLVTVQL